MVFGHILKSDYNPRRTRKANKYFVKKFHFKDIKLPIKIRRHSQNWKK